MPSSPGQVAEVGLEPTALAASRAGNSLQQAESAHTCCRSSAEQAELRQTVAARGTSDTR